MESNLNIRSRNEVALLPAHAFVMMELDLGNVMAMLSLLLRHFDVSFMSKSKNDIKDF